MFRSVFALLISMLCGWAFAQSTGPLTVEDRSFSATSDQQQAASDAPSPDSVMLLMQQLQQYEQETQALRGMVEELRHQLDTMKRAQKERYLDLDTRLQALARDNSQVATESETVAAAGNAKDGKGAKQGIGAGSVTESNPEDSRQDEFDPEADRQAYLKGRDLLLDQNFPEAAPVFEDYLDEHPQGNFRGFAHFWLGEIYRSGNREQQAKAIAHFNSVIEKHPNHSKVPDSLYKLATVYAEQGDVPRAKVSLNKILIQYPDSSEAAMAKDMMARLSGD